MRKLTKTPKMTLPKLPACKTARFEVDPVEVVLLSLAVELASVLEADSADSLVAEVSSSESVADALLLSLVSETLSLLSVSETTLVSELPGAVTHCIAVFPEMVVTSLAPEAAEDIISEIDAGIIQVLAPTVEHNEVAKNLTLWTSSPLQFLAIH